MKKSFMMAAVLMAIPQLSAAANLQGTASCLSTQDNIYNTIGMYTNQTATLELYLPIDAIAEYVKSSFNAVSGEQRGKIFISGLQNENKRGLYHFTPVAIEPDAKILAIDIYLDSDRKNPVETIECPIPGQTLGY